MTRVRGKSEQKKCHTVHSPVELVHQSKVPLQVIWKSGECLGPYGTKFCVTTATSHKLG